MATLTTPVGIPRYIAPTFDPYRYGRAGGTPEAAFFAYDHPTFTVPDTPKPAPLPLPSEKGSSGGSSGLGSGLVSAGLTAGGALTGRYLADKFFGGSDAAANKERLQYSDTSDGGSGLVDTLGGAGNIGGGIGAGLGAFAGDLFNGKSVGQAVDSGVGSGLGSIGGAALGTAIMPGIGTAIGGALGGLVGDKIGDVVSSVLPGRVICRELARQGLLPVKYVILDLNFTQQYLTPTHVIGYYFWANRVVKSLQKGRWVRFWRFIALHRAQEIAHIMNEPWSMPDPIGKVIRVVMEPVCWSIGRILEWKEKHNGQHANG